MVYNRCCKRGLLLWLPEARNKTIPLSRLLAFTSPTFHGISHPVYHNCVSLAEQATRKRKNTLYHCPRPWLDTRVHDVCAVMPSSLSYCARCLQAATVITATIIVIVPSPPSCCRNNGHCWAIVTEKATAVLMAVLKAFLLMVRCNFLCSLPPFLSEATWAGILNQQSSALQNSVAAEPL